MTGLKIKRKEGRKGKEGRVRATQELCGGAKFKYGTA
jgi:hypothetical protein